MSVEKLSRKGIEIECQAIFTCHGILLYSGEFSRNREEIYHLVDSINQSEDMRRKGIRAVIQTRAEQSSR